MLCFNDLLAAVAYQRVSTDKQPTQITLFSPMTSALPAAVRP